MNILVHYLSGGSDKEKSRAREICLSEIKRNPSNRAALVRLSQLEALDGNVAEAVKCLERALAGVENDPKYAKILAQKHLLKDELYEAEMVLRRAIDADPNDIQAWALLTHVLIQNVDMIKDASVNTNSAAKKDKALKEIEENILPKMESLVKDRPVEDAVYRSTRAFVLTRKGGVAHIREARDSYDAVANSGRGSTHTGDMILTLDMQLNDKAHAEDRAMRILAANPDDSLANYIMGSISLHRGENNQAEKYLRKSVSGKRIALLAYNDLAEVLRRLKKFDEAEKYARKAVEITPNLYVAWETLGSILMDTGKSFEEAEKYIQKACDLSKDEQGGAADVRMLISLARVQKARGQMKRAKSTMRMVQSRMNELTDYERREFEELMRSVK
jgi:predicted Zn-dependent protease